MRADEPFDRFDADDLRLLGEWLEQVALARWPRRRSLRREPHRHGKRIDLRETMKASRTTGWETIRVARTRSRERPAPSGAGLRRQPVDAAVCHRLSASHAGGGPAAEENSTRGLRVLDVADPADRRAVASFGGGGVGAGQCQGHRPVRRHASRPLHRRAGVGLTRQRAARCGGDHRVRRVGQRSARGARPGVGPGASSGAQAVWLNPRAAHPDFRPLAAFDGDGAAVLRPVSARAFPDRVAGAVRRVGDG